MLLHGWDTFTQNDQNTANVLPRWEISVNFVIFFNTIFDNWIIFLDNVSWDVHCFIVKGILKHNRI